MRLSQELNDALNQQIMHELSNVTKYMQMACFFENLQLKKLAGYFVKQSNHEKEHADKFMQYINDRTGGLVELSDIESPNLNLSGIEALADAFVTTEEATTESIEDIYDLALEEKSFIDLDFLQSMLREQCEEEDQAAEFAMKIKSVKDLVIFDATFGG